MGCPGFSDEETKLREVKSLSRSVAGIRFKPRSVWSKPFLFLQDCFTWHFLLLGMRLWQLMVEFRVSNPDWWTKKWVCNFNWENPLLLEISSLPPSLSPSLPSFPPLFSLSSFFNHAVSFYLVFSTKSHSAKVGKRDQWLEYTTVAPWHVRWFLALGKLEWPWRSGI